MDIVLDTNAFTKIFVGKAREPFVEEVAKRCDIVYVLENFERELRAILRAIPLHLMLEPLRRLGEKKKFFRRRVRKGVWVPERVEDELRRCGANQFDVDLVKLAFEISRSRGCEARCRVYLVSNDRCIWGMKGLLENYGIHALKLDDFWREYLGEELLKMG